MGSLKLVWDLWNLWTSKKDIFCQIHSEKCVCVRNPPNQNHLRLNQAAYLKTGENFGTTKVGLGPLEPLDLLPFEVGRRVAGLGSTVEVQFISVDVVAAPTPDLRRVRRQLYTGR